jgi:hypothetical protein
MNVGEYYVDKIIGKKTHKGKTLYLIKWYGYHTNESTWEPPENLKNIQNLIDNFERRISLNNKKQNNEIGNFERNRIKKIHKHVKVKVYDANECDIPSSILGVKIDKKGKKYLVNWKRRENGITPQISFVNSAFLRTNFPDLLIDYLESKMEKESSK